MRLIQFDAADGTRRVGMIDGEQAAAVNGTVSTRELALAAIRAGRGIAQEVESRGLGERVPYRALLAAGRVRVPLDHEDPAHCLVAGTGLTHLGSASTRDGMHQKLDASEDSLTDSMRMFKWGIEGGRPPAGQPGAQPEWFYKGDGSIVVRPGEAFPVPQFAEDAGEEPELTGLYVIDDERRPHRVGFAVGNEFSDHVMERRNYLYLAHSKLRACSFGPELWVGPLPAHLQGRSRIRRDGRIVWEREFLSGEANMCHTIENLEYHHFKYDQFLRPGDVHVHFFGTATLSCADGVVTQEGDAFEISIEGFGEPLVNTVSRVTPRCRPGAVQPL